jgi:ubiquinone/menaquinone biosynthesis C-methylase UbiE
MKKEDTKKIVRENYAKIVTDGRTCCTPSKQDTPSIITTSSCCGTSEPKQLDSTKMGYTDEELASLPEGADLGLGCGNPVALASIKEGETYVDLGSGAGIDCFLAAKNVGKTGKVIGVDMTPAMIDKARENARSGDFQNVEFRLGEIEHLPVADNSVDIITSNCVINLSPDKKAVFSDAFRVLKPGGRLMISDIVLLKELPEYILNSIEAYVGCVAGAMLKDEYLGLVKDVGFEDVNIISESTFPTESLIKDPVAQSIIKELQVTPEEILDVGSSVVSIKFSAMKPN